MVNKKENQEIKNKQEEDVSTHKETQETKEKKDTSEKKQAKSKSKKTSSKGKKIDSISKEFEELELKYNEVNDKYLRLSAEFDNYRKRTMKERMDLIKSAGEDILVNILPVIDDFDRAMKSLDDAKEIDAVKEGMSLIYNKFKDFLKSRGVKEIESTNEEFNTDLHDAVTKIPAPEEKLKGKVVDTIEKGYYLNDKVIRFAKVVVGE